MTQKTILQIEDHLPNKILIERILEPFGYRLLHASEGEAGITMALAEQPDLILVDMGLPDLDGQTVVTLMRQIPELKDKPMVAITAWPADTAQEMAKRYGFDGCLLKPIDVKTFHQSILTYLQ